MCLFFMSLQDQPHCALHFYRKAVEVDFSCHSALYQSALVFRQLGNPKAEIEALCLLYSVSVSLHKDASHCYLNQQWIHLHLYVLLNNMISLFVYRLYSGSQINVHLVLHWSLQIYCWVGNRWPLLTESPPPLWFCTLWHTRVSSMAGKYTQKASCMPWIKHLHFSYDITWQRHLLIFLQHVFCLNQYFRWCWVLSWSLGITPIGQQRSCKFIESIANLSILVII